MLRISVVSLISYEGGDECELQDKGFVLLLYFGTLTQGAAWVDVGEKGCRSWAGGVESPPTGRRRKSPMSLALHLLRWGQIVCEMSYFDYPKVRRGFCSSEVSGLSGLSG